MVKKLKESPRRTYVAQSLRNSGLTEITDKASIISKFRRIVTEIERRGELALDKYGLIDMDKFLSRSQFSRMRILNDTVTDLKNIETEIRRDGKAKIRSRMYADFLRDLGFDVTDDGNYAYIVENIKTNISKRRIAESDFPMYVKNNRNRMSDSEAEEYIKKLLIDSSIDLHNYHGNIGDHRKGWSFIEHDRDDYWDFSDSVTGINAVVDLDGNIVKRYKDYDTVWSDEYFRSNNESVNRIKYKKRVTESKKDDVDYHIGVLNSMYGLSDETENKFSRESAYNKYRLVLEKNSTGAVYPISGYVTIGELYDIIDAIENVKNKLG